MDSLQVTVSGTIGKQVIPTPANVTSATRAASVVLRGFLLSPISAAANVVIRDGNASGTVKFQTSTAANQGLPVELTGRGMRFDKGMHVKVLGSGAACYLYID